MECNAYQIRQKNEQNYNRQLYQSLVMRASKPVGVWTVFMWPDPIKSRRRNRVSRGDNLSFVFSSEESSISLYFLRFNSEIISFLPCSTELTYLQKMTTLTTMQNWNICQGAQTWDRPFNMGPILGIANQ